MKIDSEGQMNPILFPEIPVIAEIDTSTAGIFEKNAITIDKKLEQKLCEKSREYDIPIAAVLITVFSQIISRWSVRKQFHFLVRKNQNHSIGLLQADSQKENTWLAECNTMVRNLESMQDDFSSFEDVINNVQEQDAAKLDAEGIKTPVVISIDAQEPQNMSLQCIESCFSTKEEDLHCVWYVKNDVFETSIIKSMQDAYEEALEELSQCDWAETCVDVLPRAQKEVRQEVNRTYTNIEDELLHESFFRHVQEQPDHTALIWEQDGQAHEMTYQQLAEKALKMAAVLQVKGLQNGDLASVTLKRGPFQIIAVLGILSAGGVYVPIGINQPRQRRNQIFETADIHYVVTEQDMAGEFNDTADVKVATVEEIEQASPLSKPVDNAPDARAYIIFTSGSTGTPKGVVIAHKSAHNTIADLNRRFSVCEKDRLLAVSALDFDLSVYDIFGMLTAGGTLVLIDEAASREAPVWVEMIKKYHITAWNSVPALFDMLLTAAPVKSLASVRLVFLSGDWIGLDLFDRTMERTENCRFIAMGGATEASIWSNFYEVKGINPTWKSVPYGRPLGNQQFRVVDTLGLDCPAGVPGELWIGGRGVAECYLGRPDLTENSFLEIEGTRWYRTGDLGRYYSDGVLEFLGRKDQQVKLRGFRIELGEIEAALKKHDAVESAVSCVAEQNGSQHLSAVVTVKTAEKSDFNIERLVETNLTGNQEKMEAVLNQQGIVVESFLAELLELNQLTQQTSYRRTWKLSQDYTLLLNIWYDWLENRKVISQNNSEIVAGTRLDEVLVNTARMKAQFAGPAQAAAAEKISEHLFKSLPVYRRILTGEEEAYALLADDILSPESLAKEDTSTKIGIQWIAEQIKKQSQQQGRPISVALMDGRTGIFGEMLAQQVSPQDMELTVFDEAASMANAAKNRLSSYEHFKASAKMPDYQVPKEYLYQYDYVLNIHSLHRYQNPFQGITKSVLLAKQGGKIIILDQKAMAPVALVTSAVIEKGFANLDEERKKKHSPMMPASQWAALLQRAGCTQAEVCTVQPSFTEILEAKVPETQPQCTEEELTEFLKTKLPSHMVPERMEIVSHLPLSSNGKVDRKSVMAIFQRETILGEDEKPAEGMETEISEIWAELCGLTQVGRNQSFFEIGGDSLLATRFLAVIRDRYGAEFSLREMFEYPKLHEVSAAIQEKMQNCEMEVGEI